MSDKESCSKCGCHSDLESLNETETRMKLRKLDGWRIDQISSPQKLIKSYGFKSFVDALAFVIKVADIAEEMNHHPSIQLEWGKVGIEIWTHAVNDLTELDFTLARKIDKIE